jgi:hypothetical protein
MHSKGFGYVFINEKCLNYGLETMIYGREHFYMDLVTFEALMTLANVCPVIP